VFGDRRLVDIEELVLEALRSRLIWISMLLEVGVYYLDEVLGEREGEVCRGMVDSLGEVFRRSAKGSALRKGINSGTSTDDIMEQLIEHLRCCLETRLTWWG
jgi:hypothetical protein